MLFLRCSSECSNSVPKQHLFFFLKPQYTAAEPATHVLSASVHIHHRSWRDVYYYYLWLNHNYRSFGCPHKAVFKAQPSLPCCFFLNARIMIKNCFLTCWAVTLNTECCMWCSLCFQHDVLSSVILWNFVVGRNWLIIQLGKEDVAISLLDLHAIIKGSSK